jgi:hypothetical protein
MMDEFRFMKLFCFVNPACEKRGKYAAISPCGIRYVFTPDGAFLRTHYCNLISAMLHDEECMPDAVVSSYNAPWFNTISQQKLVNELLKTGF